MSPFDEPIREPSISMMRQILDNECARRSIKRDGIEGEELARVIMYAFLSGMIDESELVVLASNLKG